MDLILSTDGLATPGYADQSTTPLVEVLSAEDIRTSRTTGMQDGKMLDRTVVRITLTPEQRKALARAL